MPDRPGSSSADSWRQVVAGYSSLAPEPVLTDLTHLVERDEIALELSFPAKVERILELDEAAQRLERDCIARYLTNEGQRHVTWAAGRDHAAVLHDAYGRLLALAREVEDVEDDLDALALLAARILRSGARLIKWDAFRHGPVAATVWPRLNLAYSLALRRGIALRQVCLRTDRTTSTCVEREYVRLMAVHSLGLDRMDPVELEAAWCLVHLVLDQLDITATQGPMTSFWVDLAGAAPPMRLMHMPRHAAQPRFFSGMRAASELRDLLCVVERGGLPAGLPQHLHPLPFRRKMAAVLKRMIQVWSDEAPMRRGRRHPVPGQMRVVQGLPGLLDSLAGGSSGQHWVICDAGEHGVGLEGLQRDVAGVEIGTLVGLQSAGGDQWQVGTIRRVWRDDDGSLKIGIELLGSDPSGATLDDGVTAQGVLLLDRGSRSGGTVRIILDPSTGLRGGSLQLTSSDGVTRLRPIASVEAECGVDYELRHYACAS